MKQGLTVFFVLSFFLSKAQPKDLRLKPYLIPFQTLGTDENNFNDLIAFGKAVGNARVVVLGEQDHGDADAMKAKARLVRYLHEKKGFKVLAFESDAFSLNDLLSVRNKDWYVDSLRNSVSPYWAKTKGMDAFWQYYKSGNTRNTLTITGFDIGLRTPYAKANFIKRFQSTLKKSTLFTDTDYMHIAKRLLNGDAATSFTEKEKEQFFFLTGNAMKAESKRSVDYFLLQALYNKALYTWTRNAREAGLTRNLKWLLENTYRNEKMIVWTASFHAVKDIYEVVKHTERNKYYTEAVNKDSVETMVQMLRRDIKLPMYVLSTIATSGRYTPTAWTSLRNAPDTITYPAENIEAHIACLQRDQYFLDLKNLPGSHPLQIKQPMIPFLHKNSYEAVWPKVYDGLLFIRSMKPLE